MHAIQNAPAVPPNVNVVPFTQRQRLPFTVRIARSERQIRQAVEIRHAAYARHVPALAERLRAPEPLDRDAGAAVLLAEAKLDGAPLGTMRIETNAARPLAIEQSVALPAWLRRRRLAEATRLGVSAGGIGRVVKVLLFKAFYQYCLQTGIEWMVIGARSPLDRQYESLLFRDVFPGRGFVPLAHAANLPHRILGFDLESAEARWRESAHPLYGLFCRTEHPDVDLRARDEETALTSEAVA
jgi:hypothetical protein